MGSQGSDGPKDMNENLQHTIRHARHALEDFEALKLDDRGLAHSLSHHLRHVVYRLGLEEKKDG